MCQNKHTVDLTPKYNFKFTANSRKKVYIAPLTPQPHLACFLEYNSTKWRDFWNTTPQNGVKFGIGL